MWDNIGERLQKLAKVVCWIGIVGSFIWGVAAIVNGQVVTGLLYAVFGSLGSWIGAWAMYGLGLVVEYVENGGNVSRYEAKPVNPEPSNTSSVLHDPGSKWVCPKCRATNPRSRIECKQCGQLRP